MGSSRAVKTTELPPPDGGWGWAVMVASFFAHFMTHGIIYSFGVLFVALEEKFPTDKAKIALIPSILAGFVYLIGPLASVFIRRFGCRLVTVCGAVISSIGFALGLFVQDLFYLYLTIGVTAGFGMGLIFLTAIVVVTKYFQKYRAIACGITLSGCGTGAFVLSPLIEWMLETFSLDGTFLLLSGLLLHVIPCGLIFRTLKRPEYSSEAKTETFTKSKGVNSESETLLGRYCADRLLSEEMLKEHTLETGKTQLLYNSSNRLQLCESVETNKEGLAANRKNEPAYGLETDQYNKNGTVTVLGQQEIANVEQCLVGSTADVQVKGITNNTVCNGERSEETDLEIGSKDEAKTEDKSQPNATVSMPLLGEDTNTEQLNYSQYEGAYTGVIKSAPYDMDDVNVSTSVCLTEVPKHKKDIWDQDAVSFEYVTSGLLHSQTGLSDQEISSGKKLTSIQRHILLAKNAVMVLFLISQFHFFLGFLIPYIYTVDKAKGLGIDEKAAAWVASNIGLSSLAGRLIFGYVADKPSVNRMLLLKAAMFTAGVGTALGPFFNTLVLMHCSAVVYGVSSGIILVITPVLLVDLAGLDLLPEAMGMTNLLSGLATFLGPPTVGLLYDVTGSYSVPFLASGCVFLLAAAILLLTPFCKRMKSSMT